MRTIYKETLNCVYSQIINIPKGSKILNIQFQHNDLPCIWYLVPDIDADKEPRKIILATTGNPMGNEKLSYINTLVSVENDGSSFVAHYFEVG